MHAKEGTFNALEKPNIEPTSAGSEYDNEADEGRSTLSSSATIESHHQLMEGSGVRDFTHVGKTNHICSI